MKIRLAPPALTQFELILETGANETGFLIGQDIGKFKVIESLLPINFTEETIDEIYSKMYSKIGEKLVGVFFKDREPFFNEWFIEDIIMKVIDPQPGYYMYEEGNRLIRSLQNET